MDQNTFYNNLFDKFKKLVETNDLLNEEVKITGKTLTVEQAIGITVRKDFPIIKGKEKLLEADFRGFKGQAFTEVGKILPLLKIVK